MADNLSNLQSVYDKWEKKSPFQTNNNNAAVNEARHDRAKRILEEGRKKWRDKYGSGHEAPRPIIQRERRARSTLTKIPTAQTIQLQNFASFKTTPTIMAEEFRVRGPYTNPVCKCIDFSRKELHRPHFADLGVLDILNVNRHLGKVSSFSRYCSHLSFITHRRTYFSYMDVTHQVLSCSRLQNAISDKAECVCNNSDDENQMTSAITRLTQSATSSLSHMKARMSNVIMIYSGWMLMKFFTRLLSRIQVHAGQIELVKAAAERDIPIVYLPSHRSHLDYILITVILWLHNIRVPHIAAGENLNLPIFSYFMRRQGAFFIRRRLDKTSEQKDTVYRALLHSYMEEVLKAGESLEFFVEGGRSRTGKPCHPKAGLLSVVVESCLQGSVDDVYIVPVSINYEKTLDGSYAHELMGKPKEKETFMNVIRGLWGLFVHHYGTVRVDFSQPFSMKEYITTCQDEQSVITGTSDVESPNTSQSSQSSDLRRMDSFYGGDFLVDGQRTFINNVARHVVYNMMKSTSLMCTNLVAFLLLTKHRQGTSLRELADSFASLAYRVKHVYKHDVSFSGKSCDIVKYACDMLGPDLLLTVSDKSSNVSLQPNLTLPSIFNLMYYSNAVTPLFIIESIVGSSVLSLSGLSLAVIQSESTTQSITINREKIVTTSLSLCALLKEEFLFIAPCMSLETVICEAIDHLVTSELLTVQTGHTYGGTSFEENQWARRFEKRHRWKINEDDDSDDERESQFIRLNTSRPDLISSLTTYHEIVAPYAEALCLVADHVTRLTDDDMPEDTFISSVHKDALNRCEKATAMYVEHTAMETIRNSVHTLETHQYAHTYHAGKLRMIGRLDSPDIDARLDKLKTFLQTLFM